jgi:nucleotide-binding universal stress UspA family protein
LIILHAGRGQVEDWSRFPAVRKTLEQWQVLAPGSPRSAVFQKLGLKIIKVSTRGNPIRASINHVDRHQPDLVVLSTRGPQGLPLWLKPSLAQAVARRTDAMTLFVPRGCRGIVAIDGAIHLRRILLPVDHEPDAQEAVFRAVRTAEAFGDEPVELLVLHVNGRVLPRFERPASQACTWRQIRADGDVAEKILAAAREDVDLIVMATEGRQGIVDALRGSVTERVVRSAPCPVLAVPIR